MLRNTRSPQLRNQAPGSGRIPHIPPCDRLRNRKKQCALHALYDKSAATRKGVNPILPESRARAFQPVPFKFGQVFAIGVGVQHVGVEIRREFPEATGLVFARISRRTAGASLGAKTNQFCTSVPDGAWDPNSGARSPGSWLLKCRPEMRRGRKIDALGSDRR